YIESAGGRAASSRRAGVALAAHVGEDQIVAARRARRRVERGGTRGEVSHVLARARTRLGATRHPEQIAIGARIEVHRERAAGVAVHALPLRAALACAGAQRLAPVLATSVRRARSSAAGQQEKKREEPHTGGESNNRTSAMFAI